MGGGISRTINGLTVSNPKAVNMSVKKTTKNIPVKVINNISGESATIQISLAHDGEFGFTAELNIELGRKNDGLFANLFYYNKGKKTLEFVDCSFIENGMASIEFTHASDYAIVIDKEPLGGFENIAAGAYETEDNLPQTSENNAVYITVSITLVTATVCAAWFVSKKRKNR